LKTVDLELSRRSEKLQSAKERERAREKRERREREKKRTLRASDLEA